LPKFLGPVVVLTNRFTVSAAEHATMAMRQVKAYNKQIKLVGDYTFGATSFIVQRTLPCGIEYTLVNNKTWDINRNIVERTGIKPDEFVYITESGLKNSIDEQMERAIEIIDKNQF
jgi:C-terminal processing protease CtpA/Prc